MSRPLAIDLFCGLGGWTDGLLAEGWEVVGFDLERHRYPRPLVAFEGSVKRPGLNWSDRSKRGSKEAQFNRPPEVDPEGEWMEYPAQLVLQDVLTLHGSQFRNADLIVASPPCQNFSYMAMPWSRAKEKQARLQDDPEARKRLTALFDACFRIQREACEASGRHIPLIVENVRGAQKWVGRSRWNYGSFHLWGDVPALMPMTNKAFHKIESPHLWLRDPKRAGGKYAPNYTKDDGTAEARMREGQKLPGFRFDGPGRSFQSRSVEQTGIKGVGCGSVSWHQGKGQRNPNDPRNHYLTSNARKAASALIAKIPLPLARYIGRVFKPMAGVA